MNKILLWGLGKIYNLQVNLLRYFEMLGHFEVVGVTGNLADPFYSIDGYRFYSKEDSQDAEADYVIVMDNQFNRYKEEAEDFGFRGEQIFPYWILQIPNFDFEKYLTIRREKISIISNNCWGGHRVLGTGDGMLLTI